LLPSQLWGFIPIKYGVEGNFGGYDGLLGNGKGKGKEGGRGMSDVVVI